MSEPTTVRYLKLLGLLPHVEVKDLESNNHNFQLDPRLLQLARERTCSHPDAPDPEIAYSDAGKLASKFGIDQESAKTYVAHHARMLKASQANAASWPRGCYDGKYGNHKGHNHNHEGRHAATFYVDIPSFEKRGPHYLEPVDESDILWVHKAGVWRWSKEEMLDLWTGKRQLEVAVDLMVEAFRVVGLSWIRVYDGPNGTEHNSHISCVPKPGSIIGEAWFNNGTCGDHVNHHIDSGWRPGLAGIASLLTHEAGHTANLLHTFRNQRQDKSVMGYDPPYVNGKRQFYGFSDGRTPHVLPRDPGLDQLAKFFDTRPIPLKGKEEPEKPPKGSGEPEVVARWEDGDSVYTISRTKEGKQNPPSPPISW